MRSYTITELFRLTRSELCALHTEILGVLVSLADDAPEAPVARENLRLVRQVLSRPWPKP